MQRALISDTTTSLAMRHTACSWADLPAGLLLKMFEVMILTQDGRETVRRAFSLWLYSLVPLKHRLSFLASFARTIKIKKDLSLGPAGCGGGAGVQVLENVCARSSIEGHSSFKAKTVLSPPNIFSGSHAV